MKLKTPITFMVAIVLGALTAKVGLDLMKKYRQHAQPTRVIVARKDMDPGYVVTADDLELKEMPASFVPAQAMHDAKLAIGRTVKAAVIKDYPLAESQLASADAGAGLQAMVPAGFRLVTVDVSESSGVAGLLSPGCKVDVIATLHNGDQTMARTIVQNVKVQFVQRARISSSSGRVNANAPADTGPVKTVTLLVTPKEAVQIELANSSGKPRLVLRGNSDPTTADAAQVSQNELLGLPDPPPKEDPIPPPVTDAFSDPTPPVAAAPEKKGWTVEVIKRGQTSTVTLDDQNNITSDSKDTSGVAAQASDKLQQQPTTTTAAAPQERRLTAPRPPKRRRAWMTELEELCAKGIEDGASAVYTCGRRALAVGLLVIGLCVRAPMVRAAEATPPTTSPAAAASQPFIVSGVDEKTGMLRMLVNKTITIETSRRIKRLSNGQPDIAEANPISPTRILVTGKKAGSTQLVIFDENDASQTVDVLVQANLLALRQLYDRLLPGSKIDVVDNEGTIALTGSVPNLQAAEQAQQIASEYGKVLNMLEVAGGHQVMLQIRFAEVSKTATTALGVNLGYSDGSSFSASTPGQIGNLGVRNLTQNPDAVDLGVSSSSAANIFGKAVFGNTALAYFVTALRSNNLLRVLAEPNLVTTSGQPADFLAGGEFPVPIVQGGTANSTAITVEFKPFGVKLSFTPVVLGDGRIRVKMEPEVSDVDFTFAVNSGGFRVPGMRTRRLSTTVELDEGQTFAVGGLLDNRVAANKDVTPLLGDMPVIGPLFRSVRYQRQETELVVLVTPHIVGGMKPNVVPKLPGEHWRHPSEWELFMNQDTGGEVDEATAEKTPARRFIGRYGFIPAPDGTTGTTEAPAPSK